MPLVRPAGREDVALLTRLREEWAAEQRGGPVDDPGFADVFAAWFEREAEHRLAWLAEVGGVPVGMLNMLVFTRMPKPARRTSRWGYVANVYVDAAHRDGEWAGCCSTPRSTTPGSVTSPGSS